MNLRILRATFADGRIVGPGEILKDVDPKEHGTVVLLATGKAEAVSGDGSEDVDDGAPEAQHRDPRPRRTR